MDKLSRREMDTIKLSKNLHFHRKKDELSPPIPLIAKTFRQLDPAIHVGNYPFM